MRFIYLDSVTSTMDAARSRVEEGTALPFWVSADQQTAGRGRRGRDWQSTSGNLFCTAVFPSDSDVIIAAQTSFVAAIAVYDMLFDIIDPALIRLKWPNDVLVSGQKICGILLESGSSKHAESTVSWIAIGIGLNIVNHPPNMPYPVTHVLAHLTSDMLDDPEVITLSPQTLLPRLSERFEHWRRIHQQNGFDAIRKAWTVRAGPLPTPVTATLSDGVLHGEALGLGENGELRLRLANGTIRDIHAGDVVFDAVKDA